MMRFPYGDHQPLSRGGLSWNTTVRNVDRIVVLDKGEIQDVGSHEELVERNALYCKLCQMQLLSLTDRS
mgnify:CR=1 FL=1